MTAPQPLTMSFRIRQSWYVKPALTIAGLIARTAYAVAFLADAAARRAIELGVSAEMIEPPVRRLELPSGV